ncbi:hypothetical protein DRO48_01470 [Candidatus Bathyarchaeota archaeon]|nr:MAG: hypothetical protein DRO48_01470 [Candidatus Bathyarchaeota archaeon]
MTEWLILIIALIIILGYVGNLFLERIYKIPAPITLVALGIAIRWLGTFSGILTEDMVKILESSIPVVVALTLIIVVLQSALSLNIESLRGVLKPASLFTILNLIVGATLVTALMTLLGWPLLHAALLGIISTGTNTVTIDALTRGFEEKTRILLLWESIINDITIVLPASFVLSMIKITEAAAVLLKYQIAIILGVVLGGAAFGLAAAALLLWLFLTVSTEYNYVITIGMAILLYWALEISGGNGVWGVFTLGILLANPYWLIKILAKKIVKKETEISVDLVGEQIKEEIMIKGNEAAFIAKALFFTYLGMLFKWSALLNVEFLASVVALIIVVFVARLISISILASFFQEYRKMRLVISTMLARGHVAVSLALLLSQVRPEIVDMLFAFVVLGAMVAAIGSYIGRTYTELEEAKTAG